MAKSLKKYKKPPRTAREPSEKEVVLPVQRKAMAALGISPETTPVKKAKRKRPNKKQAIKEEIKQDISDTESDTRVDSGNEEGGIELLLPSAAIPPRDGGAKIAASAVSNEAQVEVEDEGPPIAPETQLFMNKWLPKWHTFCKTFPQPDDFNGIAPYCSAGMDLVLAFTHDVTASHVSKKGLPFDASPPNATPWEVQFNNVFYPADKIRNFIDINIRRFEKFIAGENMEGRMWVDMDSKYRKNVEALLDKVEKFRVMGAWERESRRVNEMMKYGVFGKVERPAGVEGGENREEA